MSPWQEGNAQGTSSPETTCSTRIFAVADRNRNQQAYKHLSARSLFEQVPLV